jgi:hypothetical protein
MNPNFHSAASMAESFGAGLSRRYWYLLSPPAWAGGLVLGLELFGLFPN